MKCEIKECLSTAAINSKFCMVHGAPQRQPIASGQNEPQVVSMSEVPKTARFNVLADKLVKKVRSLQTGSALKVELKWFPKPTCIMAKKYALEAGLRIGLRVCDPVAYLWRLNDEELKAVEQKAQRLANSRAKKVKK